MSNLDLPADVSAILEHVGRYAEGYGGHMKWNEEAKLKADMMNMRHRWGSHRVSVAALRHKCREVGLSDEDTNLIVDLLTKTQAGRRLIPQKTYRDFRFAQQVEG
ncbi:hypothetical protein [Nocardia xishanensis]|uniref:hypothetical protein n=1 Tax=Nocardia xishanensis TaxID=238964 RepID=UPI00082DB764|nr:hypothetical protein [Nocardia xishanensis]